MTFLTIVGAVMAVLFLLSYIRSGRFGATILALGAGYLLAMMWTDILLPHVTMSLPYLTRYDTVNSFLILLPGILAILLSPQQKSILPKMIASLAVAGFGVVLLLPVFEPWSKGSAVYATISDYQGVIITILLILGLFDILFARLPKSSRRSKD